MKKFSDINKSEQINESKSKTMDSVGNVSIETEIQQLIESSLSIEIDGVDEPWEKDYKIKVEESFYSNMKNVIDKIYHEEKLQILESAKRSIITGNCSWVDDEVEKIRENINQKNTDKLNG